MATAPDIAEQVEGREVDAEADANKAVFKRAMQRFDYTVPPQQEQRALALQARRFVHIAGAQWEGPLGETFENSIKLEIDKVKRGVDKIRRDYRANRIVPDFRPKGGESDQETADTLDGMHRADSNHFKAQQARDNAFEEAAAGGFGAYRLTTAWADPLDKDSDEQRINPGLTIVDADQRVFFDPNSKLYDKSDARFCFVLTADQRQSFEEENEGAATSWPEGLWRVNFDWFTPDVVVKCEYYEVEEKSAKLLVFRQILTGEEERWWATDLTADDRAEMEAKGYVVETQVRKRRRVRKWLMSGAEVLRDYGYIAGDCIPVITVYGDRTYIDNQERFEGYVARRMDRQRAYNSSISRIAEVNALAPREKPIFAAEQMPENLRNLWANQEIERHPYALVNPLYSPDGTLISAGPIGMIKAPDLPPVTAALLQVANTDLTEDMTDPDEVVANTSAEAMDIAATRVDAKSALYLDNMAQSVQREGEVYLSMCRDIYWQPGRTVETMTEDGDDGEAKLVEPYTDKTGKFGIRNDFSRGNYKVVVDVTEATVTRRDKTVKSMLKVAEMAAGAGDGEGSQAALITAVLNMDGEGLEDYKKWNRRRAISLGLVEPNEEEQAELEAQAQQQQPDPTAVALMAQAEDSKASAVLKTEQAKKAEADTALSEAKTIDTLAAAREKGASAKATEMGAEVGAHDAVTRRMSATQPANDQEQPRQRIRRGNEF